MSSDKDKKEDWVDKQAKRFGMTRQQFLAWLAATGRI
jgi:hypothetical protein